MRVGWLADVPDLPGGAEFTQAEFKAAAPEGVEIVDCPPGNVDPSCDRYVIHNCVQYSLADFNWPGYRPVTKFWHDVGPWIQAEVREWMDTNATYICCSPLQAEHMGIEAHVIPPPVDLERFSRAGARVNGHRVGAVCVGSWRNYGKAPHKVAQWAAQNEPVDFYGGGFLAPPGSEEIAQEKMPDLLARYSTFVFLPTVIEPFGRVVAEAWAAGCAIVTNELVGAAYWIQENPEAIETAAADFWNVVTS
jgi:glycosyltransferase involved in cell wall biosynthesis